MGWERVRRKDAQELCQLIRMILFAVMRAAVYFIDVTTPSIRWKIRNFPFPAEMRYWAFAAHHRAGVDYSGPCSSCSMAQQGRPEDTAKHHGSKGIPCRQLLERCDLCDCSANAEGLE